MDLYTLNRKRKIVVAISLLITIILIGLYVFSIIRFSSYFLFSSLIGLFILIILLYLLSFLYVQRMYFKLLADFLNITLRTSFKAKSIRYNKEKEDFIYHFYNKKDCLKRSSLVISYNNYDVYLNEQVLTYKNVFSKSKIKMSLSHLQIKTDLYKDNCIFIRNYQEDTSKFIEYYSYYFKNKNDSIVIDKNKQYICLYEDKFDKHIINIFNKINSFNVLLIKDGIIDILLLDENNNFSYKIQNQFDDALINHATDCYKKIINLLTNLRKEFENVQENTRNN